MTARSSSMLVLESARVKFEAEWEAEGAAPAPPFTKHDVKRELVASPERLQPPVGLAAKDTDHTMKQENSDEYSDNDIDIDNLYASSECSGEFLIEEPLAPERQFRPCSVRIKTDPVLELMCKVLQKKNKAFICDGCGAQFKLEGYLTRHLKKCSKREKVLKRDQNSNVMGGKFPCVICHFQFSRKVDFDNHFKNCLSRMHKRNAGIIYICDICSKRYKDRYTFMLHVKKCSGLFGNSEVKLPRKMRYSCGYCPKRFATKQLKLLHTRIHHTGETPYECHVCGKKFNQIANFRRHTITHQYHNVQKLHTCDQCGKQFAYKNDIIRHMLVHTKLKKFTCRTCGKKMARLRDIARHKQTHFPETAKKSHPCKVCKKTFFERSNLLVHMRVHSGEKPYSCRFCSTKFAYMTSLMRHEAIHSQEVGPFPCCVCKKPFNSRKRLIHHVRFHIWEPERPSKKRVCVKRLDCSVRLTRLSHGKIKLGIVANS